MSTIIQPIDQQLNIPLVAHHIRFTGRAVTPIAFHEFKGSALRGAFATVLRRTFCPQSSRDPETEQYHQMLCPICRLLSWDGDEETAGDLRRAYAIEPPLEEQTVFPSGATFTFGAALYGEGWSLFPYVALAAGGMGEFGVGRTVAGGERGRFVVERIDAVNPLTGATRPMMEPGERMMRTETLPVTSAEVAAAEETLLAALVAQDNRLQIEFRTPTRIITGEHTAKTPAFFPLIKQVVMRVLDLCTQQGGGRPTINGDPLVLKRDIYPFADQVMLLEDHTHWWDVKGHSSRLGQPQVLGGFVGRAVYHAPDWRPLLPWLLWGQSTHVGKNIVKGCGIYQVAGADHA